MNPKKELSEDDIDYIYNNLIKLENTGILILVWIKELPHNSEKIILGNIIKVEKVNDRHLLIQIKHGLGEDKYRPTFSLKIKANDRDSADSNPVELESCPDFALYSFNSLHEAKLLYKHLA